MISHEHKCIFIHIPKTAGMSINSFFHPHHTFKTEPVDYKRLFGWCPERKIHLQHATSKQLLETGLITKEQWENYYKFTFIRNPWDRAYSDYLWMKKFARIEDSFQNYLWGKNKFEKVLTDNSGSFFLGDHLIPQSEFFDLDGDYKLDFVGRFENFERDIQLILKNIGIEAPFNIHINKSKGLKDYSSFYNLSRKRIVEKKFKDDIEAFGYKFSGVNSLKSLLKYLLKT